MFLKKNNWEKKSYAQSGEDLIVKFIFDVLNVEKPSYIDVGAHHPFYLSNSALFYENGCRGINIEPDPTLFKLFPKYRKNDLNLNIGVGKRAGEADFYMMSYPTLNTFSRQEAENYQNNEGFKIIDVIKIPVDTLPGLLSKHNNAEFNHFLNIDAEGVDEIIIESIDFAKSPPWVMCIETLSFSAARRGVKNVKLIDYVVNCGYMVYADTNINTIFIRKDLW